MRKPGIINTPEESPYWDLTKEIPKANDINLALWGDILKEANKAGILNPQGLIDICNRELEENIVILSNIDIEECVGEAKNMDPNDDLMALSFSHMIYGVILFLKGMIRLLGEAPTSTSDKITPMKLMDNYPELTPVRIHEILNERDIDLLTIRQRTADKRATAKGSRRGIDFKQYGDISLKKGDKMDPNQLNALDAGLFDPFDDIDTEKLQPYKHPFYTNYGVVVYLMTDHRGAIEPVIQLQKMNGEVISTQALIIEGEDKISKYDLQDKLDLLILNLTAVDRELLLKQLEQK